MAPDGRVAHVPSVSLRVRVPRAVGDCEKSGLSCERAPLAGRSTDGALRFGGTSDLARTRRWDRTVLVAFAHREYVLSARLDEGRGSRFSPGPAVRRKGTGRKGVAAS